MSRLMTDTFGRVHNYLRISLTEKCSLRCRYCMPPEGVQLSKPAELMSVDEMVRIRPGVFSFFSPGFIISITSNYQFLEFY